MKKLLCLVCAAALLLGFAACGQQDTPKKPVESATAAKAQYIAAEVGENLQKTEIAKTEKHTYYLAVMQGKQVFCRTDLQGRLKILLTFGDAEPKFLTDTFERSNHNMLFYTYHNKGDETASIYAFNFASERAMKVLGSPCSDFLLLKLPDTFEMYKYGFAAVTDGIKVVDLTSGGVSSTYSMSISEMKIFFAEPDSFPSVFFGRNLSAAITDMGDRTHVRIDVTERRNNGDVKRRWAVSFSPALSVAKEIKE